MEHKTFKDKTAIANQFRLFFINIGPELASKIKIHPDKLYKKYSVRKTLPDFNFNIISDIDIIKVIDHLENKTGCGADGISNSLLKSIKSGIVQPVTVLINQMLTSGFLVDELKIAKVVPLYKKGDNILFRNIDLYLFHHLYLKYLKKMFTRNCMPILNVTNYSIAVNMALDKDI